jgi:hypothetical protein
MQTSALLDAPINEKTALSFFWFGDMDSHFRDPINFFVVPDADPRLHKVDVDRQVNVFVSAGELKRILEGLKALGLRWADSTRQRSVQRYAPPQRYRDAGHHARQF